MNPQIPIGIVWKRVECVLESNPTNIESPSGECFAGDGNTLATKGEGIFKLGEGLSIRGERLAEGGESISMRGEGFAELGEGFAGGGGRIAEGGGRIAGGGNELAAGGGGVAGLGGFALGKMFAVMGRPKAGREWPCAGFLSINLPQLGVASLAQGRILDSPFHQTTDYHENYSLPFAHLHSSSLAAVEFRRGPGRPANGGARHRADRRQARARGESTNAGSG